MGCRGSYGKGTWGVSCCCPFPSPVESKTLVTDNFEQSTTSESLRIGLSLNLEDIERQKKDLSNPNQTEQKAMLIPNPDIHSNIQGKSRLAGVVYLPAVAWSMAFPVPLPNTLSNVVP